MGGVTILLRITDLDFIKLSYSTLYFPCNDDSTSKYLVFTQVTSSARTVTAALLQLEFIVEPHACLSQVNEQRRIGLVAGDGS